MEYEIPHEYNRGRRVLLNTGSQKTTGSSHLTRMLSSQLEVKVGWIWPKSQSPTKTNVIAHYESWQSLLYLLAEPGNRSNVFVFYPEYYLRLFLWMTTVVWSLMEVFLLTCTLMFRLFSAGSANSVLFLDPPRFNIERTVNLETTVSCGRDMFQAERVLTCGLFANQGKKFFDFYKFSDS